MSDPKEPAASSQAEDLKVRVQTYYAGLGEADLMCPECQDKKFVKMQPFGNHCLQCPGCKTVKRVCLHCLRALVKFEHHIQADDFKCPDCKKESGGSTECCPKCMQGELKCTGGADPFFDFQCDFCGFETQLMS
jgi:hypothetical protein